MHALCLVVGDEPERQLQRFAEHVEVAPHKVFLEEDDVAAMVGHLGVDHDDLEALARRLPEWHNAEGGVESGRLFYWSTENPHRRFDWYEIGGRFRGYLQLKDPVKPSGLRRLLGGTATPSVNQARKRQIREDVLLSDPPAAVLIDGEWYESGIVFDDAAEVWKLHFAQLFHGIPADALLTVVDVHS